MEKKNILFIYRSSILKSYLDGNDSDFPKDFLWGNEYLDKEKFNITSVNISRTAKRRGIRLFLWPLDFLFAKAIKIGLPLEIYPIFKKEIKKSDYIICANDQISLAILFWKKLGFIKYKNIFAIVMSLQERIKYFRWNRPMIWIVGSLLRKADTILVLSNFVKKDFIKNYNLNKDKIKTYYFGIDIDFWKPEKLESGEKFILSIGNDMNRDYETLVKALPENISLKIVTKKEVKTQEKDIITISGISNQEVRNLYNKALFVVIPSIKIKNESSGLSTCLQAMACKKPVIISDAPPLRELFNDNKECLFYKPEDSYDLRKKILSLLDDEQLKNKLGENSYQKVIAKYTCKKMGNQLEYYLK